MHKAILTGVAFFFEKGMYSSLKFVTEKQIIGFGIPYPFEFSTLEWMVLIGAYIYERSEEIQLR